MPSNKSGSFEAPPSALAREHRPRALAPALPRGLRQPLLRIVGAAASCAFLVSLSVWFIDRTVSSWVHEHLGDARFALFTMYYHGHSLAIGPFSLMAAPAEALGRVAPFVLLILAAAALAGLRPKRHGRIVLVLGLSVLVAIGIKGEVKSAIGRTWPESWLGSNPLGSATVSSGSSHFMAVPVGAPFHPATRRLLQPWRPCSGVSGQSSELSGSPWSP